MRIDRTTKNGKPIRQLLPSLVLLGIFLYSGISTQQLRAQAPESLSGTAPCGARIDGVLTPGEWDGAGFVDFAVNLPEGGTTAGRLYVMNDNRNLYVALRLARPTLDHTVAAAFGFDNAQSGVFAAEGNDFFQGVCGTANPGFFYDEVVTALPPCPSGFCAEPDTFYSGGSNDGAATGSNDGLFTVLEMSHPLKSGDSHDFALGPGDTIGFDLSVYVDYDNTNYAYTFPTLATNHLRIVPMATETESPTITCPANITVSADTDASGAVVSFAATATDNCPGTPGVVCSPASGSVFAIGTTTVNCTASDAAGNEAGCNFTVTVVGEVQSPGSSRGHGHQHHGHQGRH